jgi:AcrR family transcriptional regulator
MRAMPRRSPRPQVTPRRTPSQARSRERVERILDATASLVDADGLDAVTTNAIAEAAELPVGTIYQFFPNREAVLHALLERQISALDARFAPLLGPESDGLPVDRTIDLVVDALSEAYLQLPALAALVQGLRMDPRYAGAIDVNNRLVAGWIESLARRRIPGLKPAQARAIATTTVEAGDAVLQAWLREVRAKGKTKARPLLAELRMLLRCYLSGVFMRAPRET